MSLRVCGVDERNEQVPWGRRLMISRCHGLEHDARNTKLHGLRDGLVVAGDLAGVCVAQDL